MYCPKCGYQCDNGATFCAQCGFQLISENCSADTNSSEEQHVPSDKSSNFTKAVKTGKEAASAVHSTMKTVAAQKSSSSKAQAKKDSFHNKFHMICFILAVLFVLFIFKANLHNREKKAYEYGQEVVSNLLDYPSTAVYPKFKLKYVEDEKYTYNDGFDEYDMYYVTIPVEYQNLVGNRVSNIIEIEIGLPCDASYGYLGGNRTISDNYYYEVIAVS